LVFFAQENHRKHCEKYRIEVDETIPPTDVATISLGGIVSSTSLVYFSQCFRWFSCAPAPIIDPLHPILASVLHASSVFSSILIHLFALASRQRFAASFSAGRFDVLYLLLQLTKHLLYRSLLTIVVFAGEFA